MVKDSKPELLKRLLLQTGLTDISTENTPGEGACHIHVLRFKSIRREKLLVIKDEYCSPEYTQIYWRCVPNCILHIFKCISAFKRSTVVVLWQSSELNERHISDAAEAIS